MVSKLDESVGRVVQALKDKNMLQNTIIVFMSDNGSPSFDDSGRSFSPDTGISPNWGSNFPYRGVSVHARSVFVSDFGEKFIYNVVDSYFVRRWKTRCGKAASRARHLSGPRISNKTLAFPRSSCTLPIGYRRYIRLRVHVFRSLTFFLFTWHRITYILIHSKFFRFACLTRPLKIVVVFNRILPS